MSETVFIDFITGRKVNYDGIDTIITEAPRKICGIWCIKLAGISHHVTVDEMRRQIANPVQPKPLPTYNPDQVIIKDGLHCILHGWEAGALYPTSPLHRKIEGARDSNGLCIYVHSVLHNRLVWLGTKEYQI